VFRPKLLLVCNGAGLDGVSNGGLSSIATSSGIRSSKVSSPAKMPNSSRSSPP
jgi:hypothetical protein